MIFRKKSHNGIIVVRLFKYLLLFALLLVTFVACLLVFTSDPENTVKTIVDGTVVNDITGMNPIRVARTVIPTSVQQVQDLIRHEPGPFSVGGGHFSMGGQTASEDTIHLDMREMSHVLNLDKEKRQVTVEAGITWHKLQEAIDPYGLSVQIMQSYSSFTVGGSLSVNVHGRYIGLGPIVGSVEALKVIMADGSLVEASREKNPEIFFGCIGGYGGLGVIVEATLNLAENVRVKRIVERMPIADYPFFFKSKVRDNKEIIFQNGDILPDVYNEVYSVAFSKTDLPVTETRKLSEPSASPSWTDRVLSVVFFNLPYGIKLRPILEPLRYRSDLVEWRNFEASYAVSDLAPISTKDWSYVLQEYFIPVEHFNNFVDSMRQVFAAHHPRMMNVSIRHAMPDRNTLMSWARNEVFAFVLYYRQDTDVDSRREVGNWTRELVEASVKEGGSYYLPYQPQALRDDFLRAYPRANEFFSLKHKLDPSYKFRNKLWDAYYQPDVGRKIFEEALRQKSYFRPEEQTYLTVPEWELVFASEELAKVTADRSEAHFSFFGAIFDFWNLYRHVLKASFDRYPSNWGYHFMNCVIGIHTSAEYFIKGVYESTIGRLSAWIGDADKAPAAGTVDAFIHTVYSGYAQFIHEKPWYVYPFWGRLNELWKIERPSGASLFRHIERKLSFSAELFIKGGLGKIFSIGTQSIYGDEDLQIGAVMTVPAAKIIKSLEKQKVITQIDDNHILVSLPRYEQFTLLVRELVKDPEAAGVSFNEIAGNKKIVFSVIAPKDWDSSRIAAVPIVESKLLNDSNLKRVFFSGGVPDLLDTLRTLETGGIHVDHVFDY